MKYFFIAILFLFVFWIEYRCMLDMQQYNSKKQFKKGYDWGLYISRHPADTAFTDDYYKSKSDLVVKSFPKLDTMNVTGFAFILKSTGDTLAIVHKDQLGGRTPDRSGWIFSQARSGYEYNTRFVTMTFLYD